MTYASVLLICCLVLDTAADAVRRNRKAFVSSQAGLSGVLLVGGNIVVNYDKIILNVVVELVRTT